MSNQNYYGAPGRQSQQHYAHYPSQRPASTGPAAQYASQSHPVSQSFSSYSAQAYAPSGTYNLSDYSYGSTNYGAASGTAVAARNNASADLQNLAYASGLHDTVQRAAAQSSAANQAASATQSQHASYPNASYTTYNQPRPKSVNSLVGRTEQRSSNQLNPSGSPLPKTGFQTSASPHPSAQQRAITSPQNPAAYREPSTVQQASVHTSDHPARTLPTVTQPQAVSTSAAYQWGSQQHAHSDTAGSRDFETVDPTQVYDPWPEIQRKREAARAAKALEERAQAERERQAREKAEREAQKAREAEEARKAEEERRKAEEEEKALQHMREEEKRREAEAAKQSEKEKDQRKKANTKSKMAKAVAAAASSSLAQTTSTESNVEAQMRALMAQMRQLNNQDPALLARIWEEERQNHSQPTQSTQPAVQSPAPSQKPSRTTAQNKASTSQPRPSSHAQTSTTPAPPVHTQQPPQEPQTQHVSQQPPQRQTQQQPDRQLQQQTTNLPQPNKRMPPTGTTAWPNDKKDQISKAAADWLNAIPENKNKQVTPQEILDLLNRNPRYIELCEWLESQGMKLERASFARALLAAVPDINKPSQNSTQAGQANGRAVSNVEQRKM